MTIVRLMLIINTLPVVFSFGWTVSIRRRPLEVAGFYSFNK